MPLSVDYAKLPTEQPNPYSRGLDQRSTADLLRLMSREDAAVPRTVAGAIPQITKAVDAITASLRGGGRLIFVGAGTSGRLGVLEAAECPPTFNTPPSMVQAIMAGGRAAVFRSREGAEDNRPAARAEISRRVRAGDAVVGIAASGVTPFVESALRAARARGAATILVACSSRLRIRAAVDVMIAAPVGPELIAGSTRLKAGTATKLILNMLTVGAMVRLGKVYDHWMVDLRPTSRKLRARAVRIIRLLSGVPAARARQVLRAADGGVKTAVVMAARSVDAETAEALLARHGGRVRPLLDS